MYFLHTGCDTEVQHDPRQEVGLHDPEPSMYRGKTCMPKDKTQFPKDERNSAKSQTEIKIFEAPGWRYMGEEVVVGATVGWCWGLIDD